MEMLGKKVRTSATKPPKISSARRRARAFKWKDDRSKADARYKLMTLDADEFIRRFLIHVLPEGFHRIRHYGLLASGNRTSRIGPPVPRSKTTRRPNASHY
jgi:hypothetical protein